MGVGRGSGRRARNRGVRAPLAICTTGKNEQDQYGLRKFAKSGEREGFLEGKDVYRGCDGVNYRRGFGGADRRFSIGFSFKNLGEILVERLDFLPSGSQ